MGAGPSTLSPLPSVTLHASLPSAVSILGQRPARLAGGGASAWVGPTGAGSRDLDRGLRDYRRSTVGGGIRRGRALWLVGALTPPLAPPHCGV